MNSLCILGRQPALGLAELESLLGEDAVHPVSDSVALLDVIHSDVPFARLGGTIKLCHVLNTLPTNHWGEIEKFLLGSIARQTTTLPTGKLKLGLSTYDFGLNTKRLHATALELKKAIKTTGRSVRIIPNTEAELNSAQVLHNKLTSELGWELVIVKAGNETILAQTTNVQNIDLYAARDQARPKRDAQVGMLPPKLAQIIINLATHSAPPTPVFTVLDPFCGTGVILQESMIMSYSASGSDIDTRMVEYSRENISWLRHVSKRELPECRIELGDATNHKWQDFNAIAGETYLGRPFSALPSPEILNKVILDVDTIHRKFLRNIAKQTKQGFRMCIAVPAWKTPNGFKHLPMLDSVQDMGYNRLRFVHAKQSDLVYHRENQIVGRELIVLTRA